MTLSEELLENARGYRDSGGPSSEHAVILLCRAAGEIERLRHALRRIADGVEVVHEHGHTEVVPVEDAEAIAREALKEYRQSSADARYLQSSIKDGRATEIMDMIREMDSVCAILDIQNSFVTPTEAIRKLLSQAK